MEHGGRTHGLRSSYTHGCRCLRCTKAERVYRAGKRAADRSERERAWLIEHYVARQETVARMAELLGCTECCGGIPFRLAGRVPSVALADDVIR